MSFICSLVIARAMPTLAITRNTKQLRLVGSTATSTQAYRLLRMVAPRATAVMNSAATP